MTVLTFVPVHLLPHTPWNNPAISAHGIPLFCTVVATISDSLCPQMTELFVPQGYTEQKLAVA